ncbi:hypothetical protein CWI36_0434p0010 [Hamiltosporidium magnivora]|uniref:Uncharacterized protein n=1 Tax=Hamiltosporidium magnivora TaxID=148818 RepID=A0A4Q9LEV0_9MICR|nr:hypothetical protein CWI36_0434p0010 [Hamiltosporidium magnivora]
MLPGIKDSLSTAHKNEINHFSVETQIIKLYDLTKTEQTNYSVKQQNRNLSSGHIPM